jgi:DNA (cytosine-5)-methyltransferase 1
MTHSAAIPPVALSIFAGAGGLDLGLEAAGYSTVGYIELDSIARDTLAKNRPDWTRLPFDDVCKAAISLKPETLGLRLGELDLLAGGPPCQPFSAAAQWTGNGRSGMKDLRARTVTAMLDLVESFLPRVILIENVRGFAKGRDSALPVILKRLELINRRRKTNYTITSSNVDAARYGVPQHRMRAIIVSSRDGETFRMPSPFEDREVTAWDAIGHVQHDDVPSIRGRWAELLPCIPEGSNYQWLTSRGGGEELFGYRTRYWSFLLKLAKDRPAWTISASPGPSTGPFHWNNRPLSVLELLRLQSFPVDWVLTGNEREQVRLAGNATPPLLAEIIGRAVQEQLFQRSPEGAAPKLRIAYSATPPPPPTSPTPIPPRFRSLIGPKPAHAGEGLGPGSLERRSNRSSPQLTA